VINKIKIHLSEQNIGLTWLCHIYNKIYKKNMFKLSILAVEPCM